MFKNFFNKLNSRKLTEGNPSMDIEVNTCTYDEIYDTISQPDGVFIGGDAPVLVENLMSRKGSILIPEGVDIIEMETILHIKGTSRDIQSIADQIQAMEFLAPGNHNMFSEWRFLVTDGAVMSSREEKFIALPPDEWLMMGCKFNDAISGYDFNPYTFFNSLFGNYKLPYGIEIFVTDLNNKGEG